MTPDQRVALSRAHRLEHLDIRERETQVRLDQLADLEASREKLIRNAWRRCSHEAIRILCDRGVFSCALQVGELVPDGVEIKTIHFEMKRKSGDVFAIVCEGIEVGEIER